MPLYQKDVNAIKLIRKNTMAQILTMFLKRWKMIVDKYGINIE